MTEPGEAAKGGDGYGRNCAACGAQWLPDSTIDEMSDLVEPYRQRAVKAEAALAQAEVERRMLAEWLEVYARHCDESGWLHTGKEFHDKATELRSPTRSARAAVEKLDNSAHLRTIDNKST